jgi:Uma2 family endonuclease
VAEAAKQLNYTWEDYRHWPDGERWEIIDGQAYDMSPAPTPRHQMVATRLSRQIDAFFTGKKCRALVSPIDVRLTDTDVVQPDVVVVCRPAQIRPTHIEGPPALVVEILSPSTTVHDRRRKRALYARSGVTEYWIVTPHPSLVEVLVLRDGLYAVHAAYGKEDTLESPSFDGLRIELREVFEFPMEPGEEEARVVREPPPRYNAGALAHGTEKGSSQ